MPRPHTPSMPSWALALWIAAAVVAARGSAAAPNSPLDPADPRATAVRSLHTDISLANLVRGLNLTGEQLGELEAAARDADDLRAEYEPRADEVMAEMESAFAELRAHLVSGGEPPQDVRHRAAEAERGFKELRLRFQGDLAAIERDVRAVLDEGQARIVEEFEPCLFPPHDLASPLQVGQAAVSTDVMDRLDEIRRLPPNTYARRKDRFVDRGVERLAQRVGPLTAEAEAEERARLEGLLVELRAMDDLAWALEGYDLAARFKPDRASHDEPTRAPGGMVRLTAVGRYLLAPGAADVLASIADSRG